MKQLIYRSQPFGFDHAMLAGILSGARRNNLRDDITGALICRDDLYLQLIEGPAAAIDALYAKIAVDDRHGDVRLVFADDVSERLFPHWQMLDDEAPSLLWSRQEVRDGAIEATSPTGLIAIFTRLADSAAAAPNAGMKTADYLTGRNICGTSPPSTTGEGGWRRARTKRAGEG